MQHAPSVVYPVGRSHFWAWLLCGLALALAALLAAAWRGLAPWQAGGLALGGALWAGWAWRSATRAPHGWLRCSGSARAGAPDDTGWAWVGGPAAGEAGAPLDSLRVVLDLQQRLLLEARGLAGVPRWIWVEAARAPADWLALRRALLASLSR